MTMVNDATEAALGLLGLTGSIDFSTPPTVPLKRKPPSTISTRFSQPTNHNDDNDDLNPSANNSESISCICGYTYDDGFSVACDDCSRWVHAACFDILDDKVPEEWRCWVCQPRRVDRERAARIQRARQKNMQQVADTEKHKRRVSSPGVDRKRRASAAAIDGSNQQKRKRRHSVTQLSPLFDRQASGSQQHPPPPTQLHHRHQSPVVEDEHIEIDEPSMHSYVHIDKDVVPHQHTRDKLKRLAQHWRGMTALDTSPSLALDDPSIPVMLTPDEFPSAPQTSLHPLSKSSYAHPTLSSHTNASVRPPSYTVRTTQPIPSSSLIAPYTSTIVPSTVYLSDPLNSYAHLGMPKPFVHLVGPPLDLALDARLAGNGSRFVRSGCRPNAVLRPMLCRHSRKPSGNECPADDTLSFGVFALRDLKAHEEVVLGWEWDDGSVIHHLPALIDSPQLFSPPRFQQFRYQMTSILHALSSTFTTCACGAKTRDCALNCLAEFVDGQIPPTPSPSPPIYHAEGPMGRTDGEEERSRLSAVDLGPLIGVERGFRTKERVPLSGGMSGVEMVDGCRRRTGGWGQEVFPEAGPSRLPTTRQPAPQSPSTSWGRKGKGRATDDEMEVEEGAHATKEKGGRSMRKGPTRKNGAVKATSSISPSSSSTASSRSLPISQLVPATEDKLPPKFRKKWIHKSADMLSETAEPARTSAPSIHAIRGKSEMDVEYPSDGTTATPPLSLSVDDSASKGEPPDSPHTQIIPFSTPPLRHQDPTSPSASFANLSLLSPLVDGPPVCPQADVAPSTPIDNKPEQPDEDTPMEDDSVIPVVPSTQHDDQVNSLIQTTSPTLEAPPEETSPPAEELPPASPNIDIHSTPHAEPPAPVPFAETDTHNMPTTTEATEPDYQPRIMRKKRIDWDDPPPERPAVDEPQSEAEPLARTEPAETRVEEAPPTKTKLSLKDFALRRKKQREESKAQASPVVANATLGGPEGSVRPSSEEPAAATQGDLSVDKSPVATGAVEENKSEKAGDVVDQTSSLGTVPPAEEPRESPQEQPAPSPDRSTAPDGKMDVDDPPAVSFGAKVEMVEIRLSSPPNQHPEDSRRAESPPTIHRLPTDFLRPPHQVNAENIEPSSSTLRTPTVPHSQQTLARTLSREDGEIFSPPPPKPTPLAPRAYSPPTRPRFHPQSQPGSTSPVRPPPPPPPRRPLQPAHRSQAQNAPLNARPLPSGPRALRGLGGGSGPPSYGIFGGGGGGAPRAPSADREREREHWMDRERDSRPRGGSWRGRGAGWGR